VDIEKTDHKPIALVEAKTTVIKLLTQLWPAEQKTKSKKREKDYGCVVNSAETV
jgi:hypothetical protein